MYPPTSADLHLNSLTAAGKNNELSAHSLSIMNPGALGGFPTIFNFPLQTLRFVEKLGNGRFGEV